LNVHKENITLLTVIINTKHFRKCEYFYILEHEMWIDIHIIFMIVFLYNKSKYTVYGIDNYFIYGIIRGVNIGMDS